MDDAIQGLIGMADATGAFVAQPAVVVAGAATGPLQGLSFAAKDLFDVQGHVTGCGNPDWARTHPPARRHAWAVARLLDAGATLVGKTVTDEISLGLLGINRFHGTPLNPRAPDRVPGGSSSGSASAVASGLVDLALGTDSGGSVRVPSSFTGLFGLRPTHGAIPVDGLMTQAPSFDTVGFFADDAVLFETIGQVLLPAGQPGSLNGQLLLATDAFAVADAEVHDALHGAVQRVAAQMPSMRDVVMAPEGLATWCANQRLLQSFEFSRTFSEWVGRCNPRFSYEVAHSLVRASLIEESEMAGPRRVRAAVRARLDELLGTSNVLCLPTSPILPIARTASLLEMQAAVGRIIELTCIAGLSGLPQINLPLASSHGIPVGLSLIGPRGSDRALLALARRVLSA
ncbi:MAG: gatA [Rhizobacter sp.]|nr:gatA [Rhizobacter sp.]